MPTSRSEIKEVRAGDIAAAVGLKDVIPATRSAILTPYYSGKNGVPGAGDIRRRGAENQSGSGKDGLGSAAFGARRSIVPLAHPIRSRTNDYFRHGRACIWKYRRRMKREFKVEANVGKPQVPIAKRFAGRWIREGKFVRQSGGRGQYGHVWIRLNLPKPSTGVLYEFSTAQACGKHSG